MIVRATCQEAFAEPLGSWTHPKYTHTHIYTHIYIHIYIYIYNANVSTCQEAFAEPLGSSGDPKSGPSQGKFASSNNLTLWVYMYVYQCVCMWIRVFFQRKVGIVQQLDSVSVQCICISVYVCKSGPSQGKFASSNNFTLWVYMYMYQCVCM